MSSKLQIPRISDAIASTLEQRIRRIYGYMPA